MIRLPRNRRPGTVSPIVTLFPAPTCMLQHSAAASHLQLMLVLGRLAHLGTVRGMTKHGGQSTGQSTMQSSGRHAGSLGLTSPDFQAQGPEITLSLAPAVPVSSALRFFAPQPDCGSCLPSMGASAGTLLCRIFFLLPRQGVDQNLGRKGSFWICWGRWLQY